MSTTRPPESGAPPAGWDAGQFAVVEEDAPAHHPGVVLRSQYAFVRGLLAIALAAVAALTAAVVILANEPGGRTAYGFSEPIQSIDYGGFNPSTGRPDSAPPAQPARQE